MFRSQIVVSAVVAFLLAGLVPEANLEASPAPFLRGDANASGKVDLSDAIFSLNWLFLGGPAPACLDTADADDSGNLDISDPIFVLNWLFLGGPVPPPPGPETCGLDPTPDENLCIYFQPCAPQTSETKALLILAAYDNVDGLVNFAFECQRRGIPAAVLAERGFVTENAGVFRTLDRYGVEVIGWCGPTLWDRSYEEQRDLIEKTKASIEAATGKPLRMISTRLFATDGTTARIAAELGIPYVFARGTTGARASIYKPLEHNVKVISVSAMESERWSGGSLSDGSVWARGGTPADFRFELERSLRHDRITPVCHTFLGGLKKPWQDVYLKSLFANSRVRFVTIDEFAATVDAEIPLAQIPENRKNPYGPYPETGRIPVNIQVTESRNRADALQAVIGELRSRGIAPTTIFAPKELAEGSCDLLRTYDAEGYEIAAFGRFGDMSREAQEGLILPTREALETCLGHRVAGWRASRFTQDTTTNEIIHDLGFDWHASFVARRSFLPRHEATFLPYRAFEYGFGVVAMIGAEVVEGRINALCDTSLEGTVANAAEWADTVKIYFGRHREAGLPFLTEFHPYFLIDNPEWWEEFLKLATWLSEQNCEYLTTAQFLDRLTNRYYPNPQPAVPYREEVNVEKLWLLSEFPLVPGAPTVGNRIVFFHNGRGPMCLDFLDFLATIDYPREEHLITEPGFWETMDALTKEFGRSEGVSESFGYFPIIFVKHKAYSGFNAWVRDQILALIAE